jgi:recombination protein RecA
MARVDMKKELKKDKQSVVEVAIKEIEKAHGAGAIMRLGSKTKVNVATISSGSIGLERQRSPYI